MNEDRGGGGDEAEASARLDEAEPSGPDEAQPVESAGPTPEEADAPDDGADTDSDARITVGEVG
ncbi:hypothetical protein EXE43_19110, partial [Halorubrum sp. SS5]